MRPCRLVPLLFLVALGCSGGSGIYPVEGQVVYADDNSPATGLTGCAVEFQSIDGTLDGKPASATGEIDGEGKFRLTTRKANDGAIAGKHKVLIATPGAEGEDPRSKRPLDKKYESYATSGLEETVKPGTNTITLKIDRPKKP